MAHDGITRGGIGGSPMAHNGITLGGIGRSGISGIYLCFHVKSELHLKPYEYGLCLVLYLKIINIFLKNIGFPSDFNTFSVQIH